MAVETPDARLLIPGRRPLTIGLILVITAIAFEALAVSTALPVVSRELNGVRLYGWAFSGFMLANLLGITLGGPLSDRIGPARPMLVGLTLFGTGLIVSGLAHTMLLVVVGRVVSGAGAGAVISTAYVVIGLGYPEGARARLFAVISSAWVLPSLIGPVVAGSVAQHLGWRWVFLALAPVMVLDAALVLPAVRGIKVSHGPDVEHLPLPVRDAFRLAVGTGLLISGFGSRRAGLGVALVLVGVVSAWGPFRRLVPEGTLRARGALPAAVALRGLLAFSFFTFDGFLPLTLTSLRGQSATRAGLSLTAGGVSWATGSWVAERRGRRWGRRRTVTSGATLILAGISTASLVLIPSVPVLIAPAGWLLAGLGMGLCYPTFGVIVLEEAPAGGVGRASSALQLADVLGVALGTGLAGAAVAFSVAGGWGRRPGIEAADAMTVAVCLVAIAASRRLPR
ncbi:MAG TPA: MFS transporter [Acidimicrobiales bacterium]|jgi:MFS family permease|nr:MFS transporter [Acidimicrobiales bacterium]